MSIETYIELSAELLQLITPDQAWHYRIVPKSTENGALTFYSEEGNSSTDELELLFGKNIKLVAKDALVIQKTLGKYYRKQDSKTGTFNYNQESNEFLKQLIS